MICFRISIFEPLKTTPLRDVCHPYGLWFAFELVSLNHWKQLLLFLTFLMMVVICFRISIFEPLKTTVALQLAPAGWLWFAFELVSLNHWKQPCRENTEWGWVVICFRISIFEPLKTTKHRIFTLSITLWFAFELVSLNHWKQLYSVLRIDNWGCDLLSN